MFKIALPTLVIRKFDLNDGTGDGPRIEIAGRASGLTQWLLTVMKISTLTTFKLQGEELSVVSAGLNGEIHTVIPVSAIESTECGYSKSIGWAILGVIFLLTALTSGSMNVFLVGVILAGISFAFYYFSSRMFISVMAGNRDAKIQYKKGVIEGEPVDLERTLAAIEAVNTAVLDRHKAG